MPQIETLRLFRWLWVAWHENDYHQRSHRKFGRTEATARLRVFEEL